MIKYTLRIDDIATDNFHLEYFLALVGIRTPDQSLVFAVCSLQIS